MLLFNFLNKEYSKESFLLVFLQFLKSFLGFIEELWILVYRFYFSLRHTASVCEGESDSAASLLVITSNKGGYIG